MAVSRSQKSVLTTSLPYAAYGALAGIVGGIAIFLVWWLAAGSAIVQALGGIAQATTRTTNPVVGFVAHMVISIIIGVIYAVVVSMLVPNQRYGNAALLGLLNGLIWWIVGAQIIFSILVGVAPFAQAFTPFALVDLVGHFVYGAVTALVLVWLVRRNLQIKGEQRFN
ncbi:MAG: hypothetical protein H0U76_30250 [Ktedonobacteraceae bacterium]|nr:hypothetical protein [Ktedonobacteraceae bacterium]